MVRWQTSMVSHLLPTELGWWLTDDHSGSRDCHSSMPNSMKNLILINCMLPYESMYSGFLLHNLISTSRQLITCSRTDKMNVVKEYHRLGRDPWMNCMLELWWQIHVSWYSPNSV